MNWVEYMKENNTKTDLWGNTVPQPSKQDRWNAVMEALGRFYEFHFVIGCTTEEGLISTEGEKVLDDLAYAYDAWLD